MDEDRIESVVRELEALRAEVHTLRSQAEKQSRRRRSVVAERSVSAGSSSRRQLLKLSGVATAVAAAGAVGRGHVAAAIDGDPVLLGVDNQATQPTTVSVSAPDADALVGMATHPDATGAGVFGESDGYGGVGVIGLATAAGATAGVAGFAWSGNGVAVSGFATAEFGATFGVAGLSDSEIGTGVSGYARHPSGEVAGVTGYVDSPSGVGVAGFALSANGSATGVRGETSAALGYGVHGLADQPGAVALDGHNTSVSGRAVAVSGRSDSPDGVGVLGAASEQASDGIGVGVRGTTGSSLGAGVEGQATTPGAVAVRATHSGTSSPSIAVSATTRSADGIAIEGRADARAAGQAIGVHGTSEATDGFGMLAQAASIGLLAIGRRAAIQLGVSGPAPTTLTTLHGAGELYVDQEGHLWYCLGGGAPGQWLKLSEPTNATAIGGLRSVGPYRCFDSRFAWSSRLVAGRERLRSVNVRAAFDHTGSLVDPNILPADAVAVMFTLTVTNTAGAGFLAVAPGDVQTTNVSTINWSGPGATIANSSFVGVTSDQRINVSIGGTPDVATDFVVDIVGYVA